jgi:excisionase family DNA binding protein
MAENEERLNDIEEASKRLSVSTFTVRRLVKSGHLRAVRVARRVLVPEAELRRIIEEGCGRDATRTDSAPRRSATQTT